MEPPCKGHFGAIHFVLYGEVVLFSEVKNELLQWGRGPEECPLLGGCPFLRGSFIIGSSTIFFSKNDTCKIFNVLGVLIGGDANMWFWI